MSIWDILEIDPTSEESAIKKAYAKKLKLHHPEDDPKGYQRLREAYDAAMKQAKSQAASLPVFQDEEDESQYEDSEESFDSEQHFFNSNDFFPVPLEEPRTERHPVYAFLQQVKELYDDFYARITPESWQTLMDEDIVWEMEYSQELRDGLISFLEDDHHLPRIVWEVLDNTFGFREDKEELLKHYDEEFVEYMIRQIEGTMELRYDCFVNQEIAFDIEQYLDLRESAQYMLMNGEVERAGDLLEEAHGLFTDDPDLELMRGKYYLEIRKPDEALECFTRVIALQPDDPDGYWQRALLYYDQQEYEAALADCMHLLNKDEGNKDQNVLVLAGRCHLALGNTADGRELIKETLAINKLHFRSYIHWCIAENAYGKTLDPAERKQPLRDDFLFHSFLFLRLTWFYICLYLIVSLLFDLHPYSTDLLLILLLWNAWKIWKVRRVLST
ncbi:tetratricopeptide repeat protein [Siminovitchia sp. FSL H7-0308]|uniref:tetratricopeptide repeat protein n=1 Tax=Siminovitchia sp. FSL H7-0308 TaxID=2921432 RepID=UPI0030EEB85C